MINAMYVSKGFQTNELTNHFKNTIDKILSIDNRCICFYFCIFTANKHIVENNPVWKF